MRALLDPASIVSTVIGLFAGGTARAIASAALSAVNGWVIAGSQAMLREVLSVINQVTRPSLSASWFSTTYWQVAALATLLTVPFLFAAAVQAILRGDLNLLLRAALFDLPIAAFAVSVTAPLITLLLAGTDEMCSLLTGGGSVGGTFLTGLPDDLSNAGNGFLIVVIAIVILLAGMMLLVELVMRSAAIYIVVLFLPLGFAAMVWPARRMWIKKMVETLVALILSKFAMVAILTLAVSTLASLSTHPTSLTTALTAMALVVMATASPWALLRLLPFTELAASAALTLHHETRQRIPQRAKDAAADVAAGALLDPLAAGLGGLRQLVRGPAGTDGGSGRGFRDGGMGVVGDGSERSSPETPETSGALTPGVATTAAALRTGGEPGDTAGGPVGPGEPDGTVGGSVATGPPSRTAPGGGSPAPGGPLPHLDPGEASASEGLGVVGATPAGELGVASPGSDPGRSASSPAPGSHPPTVLEEVPDLGPEHRSDEFNLDFARGHMGLHPSGTFDEDLEARR